MVTLERSAFLRGSAAAVAAPALPGPARQTTLDRFVAMPTPEYRYDVIDTIEDDESRSRIVSMVSQRWRDRREVDEPLWNHWLTITEPHEVRTGIGLLVVSGGSNTDNPPRSVASAIRRLATRTGAVVAELHMVPNQPLTFADEGKPRGEDDLVAYTWDKYLRTGDDSWPLRLPMTKAAIKAMDTVTALCMRSNRGRPVDRFVVGGASKRGWTAWLTAAVDKRVIGIVPVVIDVLNVEPSIEHAFGVYGHWPEALQAYEKMGLMDWRETPQLKALLEIEDPYSYRSRLTVPKIIVNATGDQFFTPDSSRFYIGGVPGENHLRYVPNTDHRLSGSALGAAESVVAFVDYLIAGAPRPYYVWTFQTDGSIRVSSTRKPSAVKLWHAVNNASRDFRLQTIGRAFRDTEITPQGRFTYSARVSRPTTGFAAYFLELTYPGLKDDFFVVTTGVRITPDILPYGPPPRRLGAAFREAAC